MGRITTDVGLITGFPITDTVNKLIALQARPRDNLKIRIDKLEERQLALTDLSALVLGLRLTVENLGKTSTYEQRLTTSSDTSKLVATGSSITSLGNYLVRPVRTAQSQQLLSGGIASQSSAVGAGTLKFSFGGFVDTGTPLEVLNGGSGIVRGKIKITDRSGTSAVVDLSLARNTDDVLAAINDATDLQVRAEAVGDRFRLVDESGSSSSNLKVEEVAGGTTAASLGLASINTNTSTATGADVVRLFNGVPLARLNDGNGVRVNSQLADLRVQFRDNSAALSIDFKRVGTAGTFAKAVTPGSLGSNAKIEFKAVTAGSAYDNVQVVFQDNPQIAVGHETARFDQSDPDHKRLIVQIDAGRTKASDVIKAVNKDADVKKYFTASNATNSSGIGLVSTSDGAITSGGGVVEPDPGTNELSLGDMLQTINNADPTRLRAEISADGDRLVLTDLTTDQGGSFSVTQLNGSKAAEDLGFVSAAAGGTLTGARILSGLKTTHVRNLGGTAGLSLGVLRVTNRAGTQTDIDLSGAATLDEVLETINNASAGVKASVNSARNGLLLTDTTGSSASNLIVANADATNTATKLDLVVNAAVNQKQGGSLSRRVVSEATRLDQLRGGAGITRGTVIIEDTTGDKATLNLANEKIVTIGDLLVEIKRLDLAIDARINDAGDGIVLVDTAHGDKDLTVKEGNSTTAADLNLLGGTTEQTINSVLTQVVEGSSTYKITTDADDTLTDLITKLNASSSGVVATTVNDGSLALPFRLSLASPRTGLVGQLLVDSSNFGVSFSENVKARDALVTVGPDNGQLAASSSNRFVDVLPGMTLDVIGTSENPVTINVTKSSSSLETAVQSLVDGYNRFVDRVRTYTKFDEETKVGSALTGDGTTLRLQSDLTNSISSRYFSAGSIRSLAELGVTSNTEGKLQLDAQVLKAKIATNPEGVKAFFTTAELGFSGRVKRVINQLAGDEHSLVVERLTSLGSSISVAQDRVDFLNQRLASSRERLLRQFQRMETAIAKIQANQSALTTLNNLASALATPSNGRSVTL